VIDNPEHFMIISHPGFSSQDCWSVFWLYEPHSWRFQYCGSHHLQNFTYFSFHLTYILLLCHLTE